MPRNYDPSKRGRKKRQEWQTEQATESIGQKSKSVLRVKEKIDQRIHALEVVERLNQPVWNRHKAEGIVVVATGPTTAKVEIEYLEGKLVLGVNQAFRYLTPSYTYWCENDSPEHFPEILDRSKAGVPITGSGDDARRHGVQHVEIGRSGWQWPRGNRHYLGIDGNSGLAAVSLALLFGCDRVLVIGIDHGIERLPYNATMYQRILRECTSRGVELGLISDSSPDTHWPRYPTVDIGIEAMRI